MKIPVWLASTLLAGAFALGAVAIGIEHEDAVKMRDDITDLKIEVGRIQERLSPEMKTAQLTNSRVATVP